MAGKTQSLLARALRMVPRPPSTCPDIYLALSGGVDSSVSAFLLQQRGWNVKPVLMRCWDDRQDWEEGRCHEEELRAATQTTETLALERPLVLDLVNEYWTLVFDAYLKGLKEGLTPNPDIMCNRRIKFGALPEKLRQMTGEEVWLGTGHYAQSYRSGLRAGVDVIKDQSYFLASVDGDALRRTVFPVGGLWKTEVRELAQWRGLKCASRKSSRGICFVGKRKMGQFLGRYLEEEDGRGGCGFVDVETGREIGRLRKGEWAYTRGERARIGGVGGEEGYYVVGRDGGEVFVGRGWGNEWMWVKEVECRQVDWVGEGVGQRDGRGERLEAKLSSSGGRVDCWVAGLEGGGVKVVFDRKVRGIVGGQAVVLYRGDECLGAAWPDIKGLTDVARERIAAVGRRQQALPLP